MIKKAVFANDLINGMNRILVDSSKEETYDNVSKAIDYIVSSIDLLESVDMVSTADQLDKLLIKIAKKNPLKVSDRHSPKNINDMVKNLLHHGTMFNESRDRNFNDDILNIDIDEGLEVNEDIDSDLSFEDE